MSETFELVSIENKQQLSLGKLVCFDFYNRPIPWKFAGFIDQETGKWVTQDELVPMIARFCASNRYTTLQIMTGEALISLAEDDDYDAWHDFQSIVDMMDYEPSGGFPLDGMSETFELVSIENKQQLSLGKLVCLDLKNNAIPWQFVGFIDQETGKWVTQDELISLITRFCASNRYTTLQIMTGEALVSLVEEDDNAWHYFQSVRAMMSYEPSGGFP